PGAGRRQLRLRQAAGGVLRRGGRVRLRLWRRHAALCGARPRLLRPAHHGKRARRRGDGVEPRHGARPFAGRVDFRPHRRVRLALHRVLRDRPRRRRHRVRLPAPAGAPGGAAASLKGESTMSHIRLYPEAREVEVRLNGETIATTRNALRMEEGSYAPVYYVPRSDTKMDRLERSAHRTHCPYKGDASYFSIAGGPQDAAWSYETPLGDVAAIQERLAFYPDKVEIIVRSKAPRRRHGSCASRARKP